MKRLYSITIKGDKRTWDLEVWMPPEQAANMGEDGLDVDQIVNTVPLWVAKCHLTAIWCFLQDIKIIPLD